MPSLVEILKQVTDFFSIVDYAHQSRNTTTEEDPPHTGYHTKTISARHSLFIRFWMLRRLLLSSRLSHVS